MTTFAMPVTALEISLPLPVIGSPTTPTATSAGQRPRYELRVVEKDGTIRAVFPDARPAMDGGAPMTGVTVHRIRERLNEPATAEFSIPFDHPSVGECRLANATQTPTREVQIYRNGDLRFWGIATKRRADSRARTWRYSARDVRWPITKRFFGQADRFNFLTNSDAEAGTTGWVADGAGVDSFTASTTRWLIGGHSFRLTNSTSGGWLDSFVRQRKVITATGIGLAVYLVVWYYIESWTTGPFGNRIASLSRTVGSQLQQFEAITFTERTPQDTWVREVLKVDMPPSATEIVEARMYAPDGVIYFDGLSSTSEESVSCFDENSPSGTGWDQVQIAHEIVRYAQGKGKFAFWQGRHNGKSDLNIAVAGGASGVIRERTYQAYDHQRIWTASQRGSGALDEWPSRDDGFDHSLAITPTTRTWTTHFPRRGTTRSDLPFRFGHNVLAYSVEEDLERCANDIVILGGWGTGSGREEGGYTNRSSLGGLTLEAVESAPNDAPIDMLDSVAEQRGERRDTVLAIPSFTIPAEHRETDGTLITLMVGNVTVGDVHPLRIDDGDVDIDASYRIVELDHDCEAETIGVTVNEETDVGS